MGSLGDRTSYELILAAIERARRLLETLEAQPASPKRDAALTLLRERQAAAILRLNEIDSESHRN